MQPKQCNVATMTQEIGTSFHYLNRELGQHMSNLQAWLLGLKLHIFFVPSLLSPRSYGLQVAFGTQTI
jgi:hypothetical protein